MIRSRHETTQEAWEWLNEFLATQEERVKKNGGLRTGPQIISYDHFMEIEKAWVDPEFDFGFMFGYKKQKWTVLKSNYLNIEELDLVKGQVNEREDKGSSGYNIALQFTNQHGHGHACLLSLVFQRRRTKPDPVIIINIRSSEATKRLLMDFLLVQRIAEYVYGEDIKVGIKLYCGNVYISAENFVMYHNHKDLHTILEYGRSGMENKVIDIYNKFMEPDALEKIKYRVHLRAVKRLHHLPNPAIKAKDLLL